MWNSKTTKTDAWTALSHELEQVPTSLVAVSQRGCDMPFPHWHAQVEINFIYSGSVTYRMSSHTAEMPAGSLSLFWGGQPHQSIKVATGTEFVAIHLPLVHFFRLRLPAELMHQMTQGATLLVQNGTASDHEAFRRMTDYMQGDNPARREHAIDELLTRLNRIQFEPYEVVGEADIDDDAAETLDTSALHTVVDICAFITDNFKENITSTDIASAVNIHPKYAMSAFKKSTGMTLNEYITLLRLSYAQSLLLEDDLSILDIAMDSGFGSLSAFTQAFRKISGLTASDFRRQRSTPTAQAEPGQAWATAVN